MKKILNVPNVLTILRVVLVPVFIVFALYKIVAEPWNYIALAAIFAITALTDMFDGKIARKYNLITNFGKFMDALADKFMIYSAYIALAIFYFEKEPLVSRLLIWLTAVIVLRDLVINGIRMLAASSNGTVIAAQFSGKAKTMTQSLCVVVMLAESFLAHYIEFFELNIFTYIGLAATLAATIWSGIDYIHSYSKFIDFN